MSNYYIKNGNLYAVDNSSNELSHYKYISKKKGKKGKWVYKYPKDAKDKPKGKQGSKLGYKTTMTTELEGMTMKRKVISDKPGYNQYEYQDENGKNTANLTLYTKKTNTVGDKVTTIKTSTGSLYGSSGGSGTTIIKEIGTKKTLLNKAKNWLDKIFKTK